MHYFASKHGLITWNLWILQVKCDQYWPTRGTETYGLIQITLLDTVELATYCVRTFALFKVRICEGFFGGVFPARNALVTSVCYFRTAPVRRGRWGSSSSLPGQTTGYRSTPRHSSPSSDGWKLAILQMRGPWWCTAGGKHHSFTETSWSMKLISFLSICWNE